MSRICSAGRRKGGPWGPSHQWADGLLRLHTFATVLGLMLVSLAKIALRTEASARRMMEALAEIGDPGEDEDRSNRTMLPMVYGQQCDDRFQAASFC